MNNDFDPKEEETEPNNIDELILSEIGDDDLDSDTNEEDFDNRDFSSY